MAVSRDFTASAPTTIIRESSKHNPGNGTNIGKITGFQLLKTDNKDSNRDN